VSPAVEGIEVLLGERVPQNCVDREVAASCGVLDGHLRIARDVEPAMAAARLRLAARERHVDIARFEHLAALADGLDAAQRLEQRLHAIGRNTKDLDVDVFDGPAHQSIAHPAADDECAATGAANGQRDVAGARETVAHRTGLRPNLWTILSVKPGAMALSTT